MVVIDALTAQGTPVGLSVRLVVTILAKQSGSEPMNNVFSECRGASRHVINGFLSLAMTTVGTRYAVLCWSNRWIFGHT